MFRASGAAVPLLHRTPRALACGLSMTLVSSSASGFAPKAAGPGEPGPALTGFSVAGALFSGFLGSFPNDGAQPTGNLDLSGGLYPPVSKPATPGGSAREGLARLRSALSRASGLVELPAATGGPGHISLLDKATDSLERAFSPGGAAAPRAVAGGDLLPAKPPPAPGEIDAAAKAAGERSSPDTGARGFFFALSALPAQPRSAPAQAAVNPTAGPPATPLTTPLETDPAASGEIVPQVAMANILTPVLAIRPAFVFSPLGPKASAGSDAGAAIAVRKADHPDIRPEPGLSAAEGHNRATSVRAEANAGVKRNLAQTVTGLTALARAALGPISISSPETDTGPIPARGASAIPHTGGPTAPASVQAISGDGGLTVADVPRIAAPAQGVVALFSPSSRARAAFPLSSAPSGPPFTATDGAAPASSGRIASGAQEPGTAPPHPSLTSQDATPWPASPSRTSGAPIIDVAPAPHLVSQDIRVIGPSGAETGLKASAAATTMFVPIAHVGGAIVQQARSGNKRFEIRLDPPEMGRIEIRLELTADRHVNAHVTVERAETLDLLQRDARTLERALAQAGLDDTDGSVTFSLEDRGSQRGQAEASPYPETARATPEPEAGPVPTRPRIARGALDIRI